MDAQWSYEEDRIYKNDAEKPNGNIWVNGTLGYRMVFENVLFITPFAEVQYLRALEQDGGGPEPDTFFGGGVNLAYTFGDGMALVATYSYLDNASRAPVKFDEDTFGKHQFFIGLDVGFTGLFR